jgi:hypothetical protein
VALRAGDWVEVNSAEEIATTLDANGSLDGLPFMPEMIEFCGRRLRVTRRAEKTCVEYPGGAYKMRAFHHNDVVILDVPRCSGAHHDGCGRACSFFWKTRWLKQIDGKKQPLREGPRSGQALLSITKTTISPGRYFCQSTQLDSATHAISRARVVLKCFSDLRSGSRGFFEMLWMVLTPLWYTYAPMGLGRPVPVGTLKRTPVGNLGLQPGEMVRIKSESEIVKTLDARARNRGLTCDGGMRRFCGESYRVRNRLDRMISEPTGEMKNVEGTVILDNLNCTCTYHVGGCPRGDFIYWREVWLERIPAPGTIQNP